MISEQPANGFKDTQYVRLDRLKCRNQRKPEPSSRRNLQQVWLICYRYKNNQNYQPEKGRALLEYRRLPSETKQTKSLKAGKSIDRLARLDWHSYPRRASPTVNGRSYHEIKWWWWWWNNSSQTINKQKKTYCDSFHSGMPIAVCLRCWLIILLRLLQQRRLLPLATCISVAIRA